ncbi:hypothetical protein L1887_44184 [Cichorium endivia]|nr:hypothetical protein L1887_44184 [Cichorium endivia]
MLPDYLVPAKYHITPVEQQPTEAEKEASFTQGKRKLSDFEPDILIGVSRTGKSRNMLLEEHDRHIKDRLFRAIKIEAFVHLLNDLQAEGEIDAQKLSQIMAEKTEEINEAAWGKINVKEVKNNDVYLTLDDKKSDEFILKQNLDALRNTKNDEMTRITQDLVSIPATLVRLKWQNRREIYPLQVKEEIYGAVMNAIIEQRPELKEKLLGRLEANYQYLLAREIATLRLTRKLSDGEYRTSNVTCVALDEDALVPPFYRTDG